MFELLTSSRLSVVKQLVIEDVPSHSNASGWTNHPTRGWYNDSNEHRYIYDSRGYVSSTPSRGKLLFNLPIDLNRVVKISGLFTVYANNPDKSIGWARFSLETALQTFTLGLVDPYTSSTSGLGKQVIINRYLEQVISPANPLTGLLLDVGWGDRYPKSLRGVKDITIHYR